MSEVVAAFAANVPLPCRTGRCDRDGCSVDLEGTPSARVVVDMDCDALQLPTSRSRCDYLFVGEEPDTAWVVPIELKSGRPRANTVVAQLRAGADAADAWLPKGASFEFVPVLAHGRPLHRTELNQLRERKIELRGKIRETEIIRCGESLKVTLRRNQVTQQDGSGQ